MAEEGGVAGGQAGRGFASYELVSLIAHRGASGRGHYVAHTRTHAPQWQQSREAREAAEPAAKACAPAAAAKSQDARRGSESMVRSPFPDLVSFLSKRFVAYYGLFVFILQY